MSKLRPYWQLALLQAVAWTALVAIIGFLVVAGLVESKDLPQWFVGAADFAVFVLLGCYVTAFRWVDEVKNLSVEELLESTK